VTTVEQAVVHGQIVVKTHVVVNMDSTQVSSHVDVGSHDDVGSHTVVVEDWHGGWMLHMGQLVVVITCVVVVQLVGQGTTEVMVEVTVPTT